MVNNGLSRRRSKSGAQVFIGCQSLDCLGKLCDIAWLYEQSILAVRYHIRYLP
jgi:hypothetical protein